MNGDWMERLIPKHPLWFVWAGGSILSLWMFFWWSLGLFPTTAFGSGFSRAEDTKFNTQMLLESRLLTTKQKQCLASDAESKVYWANELIRLMNLYRDKLGVDYYEPPCAAVVIVTESGPNTDIE